MSLPEALLTASSGVVAAGLQAVGFAVIAPTIQRSEARPNCCSWLIWSAASAFAAVGSWQAGATWPLAGAAMNALGCVLVLILSLRHGRFAANPVDLTCLAAATAGIRRVADHQRTGGGSRPVPDRRCLWCRSDHTQRRDRPTLRERAGLGMLLALAGGAAVLSVEPQQWAWSWGGFGHWRGAVYVGLVNAAVAASIILARLLRAATGASVGATSPG